MILARVVGNVVSTRKSEALIGAALLIVEGVDFVDQRGDGRYMVAVDSVGAGEGEVVLVVQGSSSRLTEATRDTPVDATVMAIVDSIHLNDRRTFAKS